MEENRYPFMSNQINEITEAMSNARCEFDNLENNRGSHHGGYADLKAIFSATNATLKKYGLSLTQVRHREGNEVILNTILSHKSSGQWFRDSALLNMANDGKKNTDQQHGSSLSYHKRYAAESILGIKSTNDKDDNDYGNTQEAYEVPKVAPIEKISQDQLDMLNRKLGQLIDIKTKEEVVKKIYEKTNTQELKDIKKNLFKSVIDFVEMRVTAQN